MNESDYLDLELAYQYVIDSSAISAVQDLLSAVPRSDVRNDPVVERRSILDLAGLGKEIWEGIDAQQYVNELRDEWDAR